MAGENSEGKQIASTNQPGQLGQLGQPTQPNFSTQTMGSLFSAPSPQQNLVSPNGKSGGAAGQQQQNFAPGFLGDIFRGFQT